MNQRTEPSAMLIKNLMKSLLIIACLFSAPVLFAQAHIEASLEAMMKSMHSEEGPGIAISVVKDGAIIYHHETGYANLEYDVPITDQTVFHVASVSKQFTVFAAMLLEQEGKLSFDDDIRTHLPGLKDFPEKITIRQLANHTNGLRNSSEMMNIIGFADHDFMSHRKMVEILLRQQRGNFKPGAQFQYNNSGFILLAEIIERVSNQPFTAFTAERIFKPLGMSNTLFLDDPFLVVPNKAYSYRDIGDEYQKLPLNTSIVGATGLNTTSHDLSLWAMNFDHPTIGSAEVFQKMLTRSTLNSGAEIPYTLGQEVKQYKGLDIVFHGGGDVGYRAYLLRVPAHDFSVVVLGNFEEFNPLDLSFAALDLYLAEHLNEQILESIPSDEPSDLVVFEGDYQVFPGLYVTLTAEAGALNFQGYGSTDRLELPRISPQSFSYPARPHSYLEFQGEGFIWHFSDFAYPAKRLEVSPPDPAAVNLAEFTGEYTSEELETSYTFSVVDGQLVASHHLNWDIAFRPIAEDAFISDNWFFSRIEAVRNGKGEIIALNISGQIAHDIRFEKH